MEKRKQHERINLISEVQKVEKNKEILDDMKAIHTDDEEIIEDEFDYNDFEPTNSKGKSIKNKTNLKWILVCVLVFILGVSIYGGYKILLESKENEKIDEPVEDVLVDETAPEFIGFNDRIVINLNAVDVDYTKYFLAEDEGKSSEISVSGDVNLATEGEYAITVTTMDGTGIKNTKDAIVQVVSEETMVSIPLELSCMIDGSIPMAVDTKQRVDANVITYYYEEVSQEIKDGIARLGLDVSGYHLDSYWHPSDIAGLY